MTVHAGPIQKNVPLAPYMDWRKGALNLPPWRFAEMEPGDSYVLRCPQGDVFRLRMQAAVAANKYALFAKDDRHFATRVVFEEGWGVRVWRMR